MVVCADAVENPDRFYLSGWMGRVLGQPDTGLQDEGLGISPSAFPAGACPLRRWGIGLTGSVSGAAG